jgi:predicted metal-dependent peptidase
MSRKGKNAYKRKSDNVYYFEQACEIIKNNPIFGPLFIRARTNVQPFNLCPEDGWLVVTADGQIHMNYKRRGNPGQWLPHLAHALLHLGFGHFEPFLEDNHGLRLAEWNAACDVFIFKFLTEMGSYRLPDADKIELNVSARNEERLYEIFCENGIPADFPALGTAGKKTCDMILVPQAEIMKQKPVNWRSHLAKGLSVAVAEVVENVAPRYHYTKGEAARQWFINNYPLLASLAASFKLVEDADICRSINVSVAAISADQRTIYINPYAGLSEEEYRFVMAHELLHVGLRHEARRQGRDHYMWNVACDYVINGWLVEMGIGNIPHFGGLYDPTLKNESAEAIYDRIVTNVRLFRKLQTFRGTGMGDILEGNNPDWWKTGAGIGLDDFYRSALSQGYSFHEASGRGLLPSNLVEEIMAQATPPPGWEVELGRWFEAYFIPLERKRSYARLSRRQNATPDIPRPRYVIDERKQEARTFGVVLDTSGSMDTILLAKALGAIASYSLVHEVPAVRVIFCDAAAYDNGFMPPEAIAGQVKVRGRGGTVLQPGINLLETAEDFPDDAPILIITDGACDNLRVRREHAYLLPQQSNLPFVPAGPVFRIS